MVLNIYFNVRILWRFSFGLDTERGVTTTSNLGRHFPVFPRATAISSRIVPLNQTAKTEKGFIEFRKTSTPRRVGEGIHARQGVHESATLPGGADQGGARRQATIDRTSGEPSSLSLAGNCDAAKNLGVPSIWQTTLSL